ncbi:LysR family transcriptional regulator [Desulforegula conservatrix]|uniref:LysR family transcriptional regulator n=1 Tax=Desulforegula conservatrix TaxID=153026 RepID=UPI0018DB338D|nr:LysR family transcriptional regulator [Desulforegula conservatrix]
MELYHLKTFLSVAETGNLTKAAQQLFTSQPAISAHIKAIEEELGIALFSRNAKGMILTKEGAMLKDEASKVLESFGCFIQKARQVKKQVTGEARIAVNSDPEFLRLHDLFKSMKSSCPDLKFNVTKSTSGEILDDIKAGKIDGGFAYGKNPHPEVKVMELQTSSVVIVGPFSLSGELDKASWQELACMPWILQSIYCPFNTILKEIFEKQGLKPLKVAISDDEDTMLTLSSAGIGLTLMEETRARKSAKSCEVAIWNKETFGIPLLFAYQRSRQSDPLIQAMLENLERIWNRSGDNEVYIQTDNKNYSGTES